jgi:HK97 family phage prohead protease
MSQPQVERRFILADDPTYSVGLEERDGEPAKIRGTAAVYNRESHKLGDFREVILPGAFTEALTSRKNDVVALWNHSNDAILGRLSSGTLKLSTDERGLHYEIDPPDTQLGRDLMTLIRRRDIVGSSFAFTVDPEHESYATDSNGETIRTISKVSGLYDVSVVAHAAYPQTSVSVRSYEMWLSQQKAAPEGRASKTVSMRSRAVRALAGITAKRLSLYVPR